jgi:Ribulose-phosphate 3 epimerase family
MRNSSMRISASLYAADPLRLAEAVEAVAPHVGSLHIDIMDGRFASAFGLCEALVRSLVAERSPPLDVHLMVEVPEPWIHQFATLGVRSIAFHAEAVSDVRGAASSIRAAGCLATFLYSYPGFLCPEVRLILKNQPQPSVRLLRLVMERQKVSNGSGLSQLVPVVTALTTSSSRS